ncbi:MAG: hypothetical protein LBS75_00990 [Synergistaceae bacterium]|jgi:hypothetical protein|nr:hypothetical protein [Synergistaceae bacterium]
MRRFLLTLLCIAAISAAVFYVVSVPRVRTDIRAVEGIIDLRGADFAGGLYALAGEWEFYWDRFCTPEELRAQGGENNPNLPTLDSALVHVPGSWHGAGFYRLGHGTYRLTVLIPEANGLTIYVPEIRSASAVWVNDRKIHGAGRVGTDRDEEIPRPKNGIYDLRADNGCAPLSEMEIVVQVSSYDRFFGGIRNNFHIGADSMLLRWAVGRWASAASLAGAFLVIGLYHFMLWLFQRPRYSVYLMFAIHCAVEGVRFLIEKDSVVQYLADESRYMPY